MDQETDKGQLQRDKEFLRELFQTDDVNKSKQVLVFASDSKLNTLLKFLHFLTVGDIKIRREDFKVIEDAKKLKILKKFVEKKAAVQRLLKSERKEKLKVLTKLLSVYPQLLYCLFNE